MPTAEERLAHLPAHYPVVIAFPSWFRSAYRRFMGGFPCQNDLVGNESSQGEPGDPRCPDSVPVASSEERIDGLPLDRINLLRSAFQNSNEHAKDWWNSIEGSLLPLNSPASEDRWFVSDAARDLFSSEELIEHYADVSHQAVPGILTALGLLGTFSALLLGLADLRYTDKAVLGLSDLINALSGKFFTSVLALGSDLPPEISPN